MYLLAPNGDAVIPPNLPIQRLTPQLVLVWFRKCATLGSAAVSPPLSMILGYTAGDERWASGGGYRSRLLAQYVPPRRRMQGVDGVGTFVLPAMGWSSHDGFQSVLIRLMASRANHATVRQTK